jgi:hypothetical protein
MDELETGTATEAAPQGLDSPEPTGEATASATPAAETPAAPHEESFIDPSQLPDELKAHWKRMHGAYTKTREELKRGREAYSEVQKFYSDPDYQDRILRQVATQRGYQIVDPRQQAQASSSAPTSSQPAGQAPQEFVQKIEARLAPELKWMAKSLADAQWEGIQPLIQERHQETQSKHAQDYEAAASELGNKFPGWEAEEDNMSELLGFLQGKSMRHPKFGNRLEVLYKASQLLAGHQGHVVQEYGKRTAEAARSRTVSSNAARPSLENYSEQIRKAPKSSDAWEIAQKVAIEEARKMGVNL